MDISLVAIVAAAAASMGFGAFWFSPSGFGNQWIAARNLTKKQFEKMVAQTDMQATYFASAVVALIQAGVLNVLQLLVEPESLLAALGIGLLAWAGFSAPTLLNKVLWGTDSTRLFSIESAYQLANLLLISAVVFLLA